MVTRAGGAEGSWEPGEPTLLVSSGEHCQEWGTALAKPEGAGLTAHVLNAPVQTSQMERGRSGKQVLAQGRARPHASSAERSVRGGPRVGAAMPSAVLALLRSQSSGLR